MNTRSMPVTPKDLRVGDLVLFDHFGGTNREGRVVKLTANAVSIEWTAPSSGITRTVRLSTKTRTHWGGADVPAFSEFGHRNVRRVLPPVEEALPPYEVVNTRATLTT